LNDDDDVDVGDDDAAVAVLFGLQCVVSQRYRLNESETGVKIIKKKTVQSITKPFMKTFSWIRA
jgi:hypothetical protein